MFTIEQIDNAHSKVKSGADFPTYILHLRKLGVIYYETFVTDNHTNYLGTNGYSVTSPAKHLKLEIAKTSNVEQFKKDLKAHQKGETDYQTFCEDCAKSGIEKWVVDLEQMTCTYFDISGNESAVENIPH